jgi:SAM-dependent methyltransferase
MVKLVRRYLADIYSKAMGDAYECAFNEILATRRAEWRMLDCGAGSGRIFDALNCCQPISVAEYFGLEWSAAEAENGRRRGLEISSADLNKPLPFGDDAFDCVVALSVLEHLSNGCAYLQETKRILKPGGQLILLTPNIATYFTAAQILFGRMPTTGPHPDSNQLMKESSLNLKEMRVDAEGDTPTHRHLVVFSFTALRRYLALIGFDAIKGRGFGLYPAPKFAQSFFQSIDPYHCHQMVFSARKPSD